MANTKISALSSATTPLTGSEILPINQSGVTDSVSVANLTSGRAISFLSASVGPNYLSLSGAVIDIGNNRNSPTRIGISNQNSGTSATTGIDLEAAGGGWQIDVPADVVTYANPLIGKFGGTEKFRWDATGNYVPSVASKGINFTANTGASGKTSQLLNWYEEGTWTPSVTSGSGTITTMGTVIGRYTRIGRQVAATFSITITTNGTAASYLNVDGIPFTASSDIAAYAGCGGSTSTGKALSLLLSQSQSRIYVRVADATYPGGDGITLVGQVIYNV